MSLEMRYFHWKKHDIFNEITIFSLKKDDLFNWKQGIFIGNREFSLETRNFHWKQCTFIGNKEFSIKTRHFHWEQRTFLENTTFALETMYFHWKQRTFLENKANFFKNQFIFLHSIKISLPFIDFMGSQGFLGHKRKILWIIEAK